MAKSKSLTLESIPSLDATRALTRANRERCAELTAEIHRKTSDIRDSFFEIGEALVEINNNALFKAAGHPTFPSYLAAEGLMSPSQASKLISVAELMGREDAITLGTEKAYALTQYARALPDAAPL